MLTPNQYSKLEKESQIENIKRIEQLIDSLKTIAYECDEMLDNYVEESAVVDVRNIARAAINSLH